jgi:tetratricopeptide (TPR) repeat protein
MTLNNTTDIISTYWDYFTNFITELDLYLKFILTIATLLGGFAAIHYFILYLRHRNKIDPKLVDYLDTKFDSIKQPELTPLPVMDFVDGLPQLDDAKKRDAFENGMKLRDEHKPLEAIDRFRFLLSINPPDEQKAALLTLIGNSFLLTGNQDEALGHYKEALKAAENADSPGAKSVALGNIGLIYSDKGEADEALKYHQQALEIHREIGFKQGEASALGNIGLIYRAKGEADEALKYHQQALEIHREIGYRQGEASQLGNIGLIYRAKGEADEALKYLQQALEIFESIGAEHLVNQTTNIIKKIINSD